MITLEKAIAGIFAVTLVNGFFSTTMFTGYKEMYTEKIERLESENSSLRDELSHYDEYGIVVDVTMYQPVYPQTDTTPDITADGTRIRISKASQYKFVALSRIYSNAGVVLLTMVTLYYLKVQRAKMVYIR